MAVRAARRWQGAVAAFTAAGFLAAAADHDLLGTADGRIFEAIRARRDVRMIGVARRVSALAEPPIVYPVLLLAGAAAARRGGWRRACAPCLVVASGAAVRKLLADIIARQRPPAEAWLAEPEGFSLPSRHTTLAVLAVGAGAWALGLRGAAAGAAPLVAAAGVGASRVCLGVHWPADVAAGWLFAEGWLLLTCPQLRTDSYQRGSSMESPADIDVRCSAVVFRGDSVLLVHRAHGDADDWVLPGGTPYPGESMAACAQRETLEETGLPVTPSRVAFVLESLAPGARRRMVDLVFLAVGPAGREPESQESQFEARFVPLSVLPGLALRPPLAGYLRALRARGPARTAAYLGNLWRPDAA